MLAASARHPHRRVGACTACARRLEQALALYGGSFLGQFYLRESTAFDEWAALTREALHQDAVAALARLAGYYERRGN
ncbi:BTAD domain-containing putative transcriptional regulator, partial [Enterobacter asburiae]|uniref:BTAD domain-containing putative transcriptional regulator n=1 Tax=Enterobacter asburiae TaxID=61645 RepID=UPI00398BB1E5